MNFEIAPKSAEIEATWNEARMYCFSLNIDGKVGWRLPTGEELNEIYESENEYATTWYHWTADDDESDGRLYVRPVRDLMIEIAPEEYRKYNLTWDEANMYCFSLNIDGKVGWRLPTFGEYYGNIESTSWCQDDITRHTNGQWPVVPVRDLKDD